MEDLILILKEISHKIDRILYQQDKFGIYLDSNNKVNAKALNNINKIYNPITKQPLLKFETFDPIKGVIPGIAEREIGITSVMDTAVYTYSTDRSGNIDDRDY